MSTQSPNMGLTLSTIAVDSGLAWETNLNLSLTTLDGHTHASGSGVQIQPNGLNINTDLTFQSNQATNLKAALFVNQTSLATLNALYTVAGELWYNDPTGAVQITAAGAVNATSSGISSGTASASFSAGTLVVLSAASTPANIQGGSLLLGNNIASSKYLTLSPPNAMASNFTLTLPSLPASQSFVTLDTSGNFSGYAPIAGGLTTSNLSPTAGILGTQLANQTITATQIANATITGTQIASTTVAAGNIVNNTITTNQISNSAGITGTQIASNTVTDSNLSALLWDQNNTSSTTGITSTFGSSLSTSISTGTNARPVLISVTTVNGTGFPSDLVQSTTNSVSLYGKIGSASPFLIATILQAGVSVQGPLNWTFIYNVGAYASTITYALVTSSGTAGAGNGSTIYLSAATL